MNTPTLVDKMTNNTAKTLNSIFLVAGCMAKETKPVMVPQINEEHRVQIKNTYILAYT
jgi:hypothetical protein